MDEDLVKMSKEELVAEVKKLRAGIREHRDCSGHDLCWYHPDLWALLPDSPKEEPIVPEWPQFMKGCISYRQSLDSEGAHLKRTDKEFKE